MQRDPFDLFVAATLMLLAGVGLALWTRHLLRTGRFVKRRRVYTRQQDPAAYWAFTGTALALSVALLGLSLAGIVAYLLRTP